MLVVSPSIPKEERTRRWVILEELQQLDQYPRTRNLVVIVPFGALIVHDYPLQPVRRFDVAAFVLFCVVLDERGNEGSDGEGDSHVWIVHQGYYALGPFVLYDAGVFPVEAQEGQGCLLLDERFRCSGPCQLHTIARLMQHSRRNQEPVHLCTQRLSQLLATDVRNRMQRKTVVKLIVIEQVLSYAVHHQVYQLVLLV